MSGPGHRSVFLRTNAESSQEHRQLSQKHPFHGGPTLPTYLSFRRPFGIYLDFTVYRPHEGSKGPSVRAARGASGSFSIHSTPGRKTPHAPNNRANTVQIALYRTSRPVVLRELFCPPSPQAISTNADAEERNEKQSSPGKIAATTP